MRKRFTVFLSLVAVGVVLLVISLVADETAIAGSQPLGLERPVFVDVAHAEARDVVDIGSKLDDEAGISAYLNASSAIDLAQVRELFRTIEAETGNYIIGSIQVPNYKENYDVHVYVHKDGWILAYYLKDNPAAKIVDVKAKTVDNNKLETVIGMVAATAGVPLTDVKYYDFRYPNATNLLLVGEDSADGNDFEITLPSEFAYLESSISYAVHGYYLGPCMEIDGKNYLGRDTDYWDDETAYHRLDVSELLPGRAHTFVVCRWDYGALAVVYRVP